MAQLLLLEGDGKDASDNLERTPIHLLRSINMVRGCRAGSHGCERGRQPSMRRTREEVGNARDSSTR